jgi:hypothetical protein
MTYIQDGMTVAEGLTLRRMQATIDSQKQLYKCKNREVTTLNNGK